MGTPLALKIVVVIALILQLIAIIYAIRLVRRTKYNAIWILCIIGFVLIAVERYFEVVGVENTQAGLYISIALGVSVSICVSVAVMFAHRLVSYLERVDRQRSIFNRRIMTAVLRAGSIGFNHVPVDGSKKMADDLMESIEPFDSSQAVPFQTAYLAGYMADKYEVNAEESVERANQRVKQSTASAFAQTAQGYTTITPESTSITLHGGKAKYALYPVWLLNTTWNNKQYTFAMNGQTGKFVEPNGPGAHNRVSKARPKTLRGIL